MNLTAERLARLNTLLKDKALDLPEIRREVTPSGNNYQWLQRNLTIRNPVPSPELKELLYLK